MQDYLVRPNPTDLRLTRRVAGVDQDGERIETTVPVERPLTLFLNGQEIVTMMTVGDYPECLAVGYLLNQNMLLREDGITGIDSDEEIDTVVGRPPRPPDSHAQQVRKSSGG